MYYQHEKQNNIINELTFYTDEDNNLILDHIEQFDISTPENFVKWQCIRLIRQLDLKTLKPSPSFNNISFSMTENKLNINVQLTTNNMISCTIDIDPDQPFYNDLEFYKQLKTEFQNQFYTKVIEL